jgi:hypothetical protein
MGVDGMNLQPFMVRHGERKHITEAYVSTPPALALTDQVGDVWCLGFTNAPHGRVPGGEFAYDVLRNGRWAGEFASRIEMRGGRIRIFTAEGWKRWSGHSFI